MPATLTNVSPAVAEIIKMAQAGVGEEVMLAYIQGAAHGFNLNSDGIVYLNDLGVSSSVITAMLQRDAQMGTTAPVAVPQPEPPTLVQTQMVSNVASAPAQPAPQDVEAPPQPAVATQPVYVSPPAEEVQVSYFYEPLSPYGSWMYVGDYGWCWQPTVVVSSPGWRPYCQSGRWYWSDAGWYWHSDYSWGWAPFHYGRWFCHGSAGWVWCPGTVWGPSWVSWRSAPGYCGWAPLPPAAGWSMGVGFTYHGGGVGVGFEFGLGYSSYSWVSVNRFCSPNVYRHCEPVHRGNSYYHSSTVVNNYTVNKTTIINNGVGRDHIARAAGNDLREISIKDRAWNQSGAGGYNTLRRDGSRLVAERPVLPKTPPAIPASLADRSLSGTSQKPATGAAGAGISRFADTRPGSGSAPSSRYGTSAVNPRDPLSKGGAADLMPSSRGNQLSSSRQNLAPASTGAPDAKPGTKGLTMYGSDKSTLPTVNLPGNTASPRSVTADSVTTRGTGSTRLSPAVTAPATDNLPSTAKAGETTVNPGQTSWSSSPKPVGATGNAQAPYSGTTIRQGGQAPSTTVKPFVPDSRPVTVQPKGQGQTTRSYVAPPSASPPVRVEPRVNQTPPSSQPRTHSYGPSASSYSPANVAPAASAPARSYSAPAPSQTRSYSPPATYSASGRSYSPAPSAPTRSYSPPPSAPSRSYSAPASAPARSYSAPSSPSSSSSSKSSGGSSGGGRGGR